MKIKFFCSPVHDKKQIEKIKLKLQKNNFVLITNFKKGEIPFVFIATGGTENAVKAFVEKNKIKALFLFYQDGFNSLAASCEIKAYLDSKNILSGVYNIFNFSKEDKNIFGALLKLKKFNTGFIGGASDWLIASAVSAPVKKKFNIKNIPLSFLEKLIFKKRVFSFDYKKHNITKNKTTADALKVYAALKEVIKLYELQALTLKCFDIVVKRGITACIALSLLNKEGIVCGCEGDIPSALTMSSVKALLNKPSFMANPSIIDDSDNTIKFAHCAVPFDMVKKFKINTHFETDKSAAVESGLNTGAVTVLKFYGSSLDKIFCEEGVSVPFKRAADLCRTQVKIKFNDFKVNDYLKNPPANHVIITYGRNKKKFLKFFEILKIYLNF